MALNIETYSNAKGGNSFFKAVGHPLAYRKAVEFFASLSAVATPIAIYDPLGYADSLGEFYPLSKLPIEAVYVQAFESFGSRVLGQEAKAITDFARGTARRVLVTAFDAQTLINQIRGLLPADTEIHSLDALRLPESMLTNPRRYLDPLNFATNFAFFRDHDGHHTRLVSANYWSGYGAKQTSLWFCLFDADGSVLAEWSEPLKPNTATVVIDSRTVKQQFKLNDFCGSLFVHAIGVAGHDIVKYALDTFGEEPSVLSCTHDANAWPSDLYSGLPAPVPGERVVLWVQNSHPCPIPAGALGLNRMGSERVVRLDREIGPFATYALDVGTLMPDLQWPGQLEVQAGKHFVRPRYEIFSSGGRRRIAHANVERTDLKPDPGIAKLGTAFGKGYLLPAPVLPPRRWRSVVLPTPMASCQTSLPTKLHVYDSNGALLREQPLGALARDHATACDVETLLAEAGLSLEDGYGHIELLYDTAVNGPMDGWLHALFRYEDKRNHHVAETSFGAHIFNTLLTYRDEPQSYAGRPPGLSTRLFLRIGEEPLDTLCHLIYPASAPWRPQSETRLILIDADGNEVACKDIHIPCSGSRLWRYKEMFSAAERSRAGANAYVLIRDLTCRLFGYHGLLYGDESFSLDHMFGF